MKLASERSTAAGDNLRGALPHGLTSLRVLGEMPYVDLEWRDAIRSGERFGPRLYVAGPAITWPGGHGLSSGIAIEARGPRAMTEAVRDLARRGVDVIKLMLSGGLGASGGSLEDTPMTDDEVRAAVDAAHDLGKRVAAHATGPATVKQAVTAGVDSVEHAYSLDDEAIDLMAEHGTWYVPTLHVTQRPPEAYQDRPEPGRTRLLNAREPHFRAARRVYQAGIRIAAGRDCVDLGADATAEIRHLASLGMPAADAIAAATGAAAELAGEPAGGTLAAGRYADVLVLAADPLVDLTALERPRLVVLGGQIV